jgi:hypothetical protein
MCRQTVKFSRSTTAEVQSAATRVRRGPDLTSSAPRLEPTPLQASTAAQWQRVDGVNIIRFFTLSTPRKDQNDNAKQDYHSEQEAQVILAAVVMYFVDLYTLIKKRHYQGNRRDNPVP